MYNMPPHWVWLSVCVCVCQFVSQPLLSVVSVYAENTVTYLMANKGQNVCGEISPLKRSSTLPV